MGLSAKLAVGRDQRDRNAFDAWAVANGYTVEPTYGDRNLTEAHSRKLSINGEHVATVRICHPTYGSGRPFRLFARKFGKRYSWEYNHSRSYSKLEGLQKAVLEFGVATTDHDKAVIRVKSEVHTARQRTKAAQAELDRNERQIRDILWARFNGDEEREEPTLSELSAERDGLKAELANADRQWDGARARLRELEGE